MHFVQLLHNVLGVNLEILITQSVDLQAQHLEHLFRLISPVVISYNLGLLSVYFEYRSEDVLELGFVYMFEEGVLLCLSLRPVFGPLVLPVDVLISITHYVSKMVFFLANELLSHFLHELHGKCYRINIL